MSQKILGLDLGTYSVKAALFDVTFRTRELTDLFESAPLQADEIDAEEVPVVTKEAVIRLIQENQISPSTVITAISGLAVSARVIDLPLPARQVAKVLPFELEAYLPFDLDELLIDHHVVSSEKNRTVCIAVATKRSVIAEHLALARSIPLEPAFVTLDTLALFNVAQFSLTENLQSYALVDIGHQKTSICIVSGQNVAFVRTLFTAGKAITQNIRSSLDLTWEQAQDVKHTHGVLELENHPLKSADMKRLSTAIRHTLDPLIREISQTIQAYRAQYSAIKSEKPPVERIFLTGGTALLSNLPEYIHSLTNLHVERLPVFAEQPSIGEKLGKRQPVMAQAIGLGLRAASRGANARRVSPVNFRTKEFAFARDFSGIKEKAWFFGKWAAALFIVAMLHIALRYESLSIKYSQLEKEALRTFGEYASASREKPKTSTEAVRAMENQLRGFRQKQELLTAGLNEMTALGVLREISNRISGDIPIDAQEISINRNKIVLRAHTDSIASVDKIISSLRDVKTFQEIEKGDIHEGPGGKKVFMITVTVGNKDSNETAPRRSR